MPHDRHQLHTTTRRPVPWFRCRGWQVLADGVRRQSPSDALRREAAMDRALAIPRGERWWLVWSCDHHTDGLTGPRQLGGRQRSWISPRNLRTRRASPRCSVDHLCIQLSSTSGIRARRIPNRCFTRVFALKEIQSIPIRLHQSSLHRQVRFDRLGGLKIEPHAAGPGMSSK